MQAAHTHGPAAAQGWSRIPEGANPAQLLDKKARFGLRWCLTQLWGGRVICDPHSLAGELGGDSPEALSRFLPIFREDPLLGPGPSSGPPAPRVADFVQGLRALISTINATRALDYGALLARALHATWQDGLLANHTSALNESGLVWACHSRNILPPPGAEDRGNRRDKAGDDDGELVKPFLRSDTNSTIPHCVAKFDFKATYPSIIIALKLCATSEADLLPIC